MQNSKNNIFRLVPKDQVNNLNMVADNIASSYGYDGCFIMGIKKVQDGADIVFSMGNHKIDTIMLRDGLNLAIHTTYQIEQEDEQQG
jgi:hypothetical protein